MTNDKIKLVGKFKLEHRDVNGNIKSCEVFNTVVTVGKALITSRLGQSSDAVAAYIALGTSSTAVSAGQTALQAETSATGLGRALATFSQATTTTTNDTFQLTKEFTNTSGGTVVVEEIGVFNASSSGTMLSRALTGTKSISNGESITATYTLALS